MASKKPNDGKIISFSDIQSKTRNFKPINELEGKEIIIKSVKFDVHSKYGEMGIVMLDDGNEYYTFSNVLVAQLKAILPYLNEGKLVKATLKKVKRYLTLA